MQMTPLTRTEQLDDILSAGRERPVFVFKHSTACPISASAKARFEEYMALNDNTLPEVFLLKVIEDRPLSNRLAEATGLRHQSPQVVLIGEGKALWSAAHHGIHGERLDESKPHWKSD